jgi:hypothetical protein
MRYLLLAVLLLPSISQAYVSYSFDGVVKALHDDSTPSDSVGPGTTFSGTLGFDNKPVEVYAGTDLVQYLAYNVNFSMQVGGMNVNRTSDFRVLASGDSATLDLFGCNTSGMGQAAFTQVWMGSRIMDPNNRLETLNAVGWGLSSSIWKGDLPYGYPEFNGLITAWENTSIVASAPAIDPIGDEAPVPEPSTFYLFGMGLSALGFLRFKARS